METPWTTTINPAWLPLDGENKAWVGLVAGQFGARANVDILDWTFTQGYQTFTCPDGRVKSGDNCLYTYNRQAAADYAITWAQGNCSLFCAFNFSALYPTPEEQEKYRCGMPESATNCANFVSQALFYGSFPMTGDWYCFIKPNGLCERGNIPSGYWAGAQYENGLPYYLTGSALYIDGQSTNLLVGGNTEITNPNCPRVVDPTAEPEIQAAQREYDALEYPWDPFDPIPSEDDVDAQATRIRIENVWNGCHNDQPILQEITTGDLMFTDSGEPPDDFQHVAIVVGWGPYVHTWGDLQGKLAGGLSLSPVRTATNVVPYVVDHGPQGEAVIGDTDFLFYTSPKPYYALQWPSIRGSLWTAVAIPWGFAHLPSQLTIPFSEFGDLQEHLDSSIQQYVPTATGQTISRTDLTQACHP